MKYGLKRFSEWRLPSLSEQNPCALSGPEQLGYSLLNDGIHFQSWHFMPVVILGPQMH